MRHGTWAVGPRDRPLGAPAPAPAQDAQHRAPVEAGQGMARRSTDCPSHCSLAHVSTTGLGCGSHPPPHPAPVRPGPNRATSVLRTWNTSHPLPLANFSSCFRTPSSLLGPLPDMAPDSCWQHPPGPGSLLLPPGAPEGTVFSHSPGAAGSKRGSKKAKSWEGSA